MSACCQRRAPGRASHWPPPASAPPDRAPLWAGQGWGPRCAACPPLASPGRWSGTNSQEDPSGPFLVLLPLTRLWSQEAPHSDPDVVLHHAETRSLESSEFGENCRQVSKGSYAICWRLVWDDASWTFKKNTGLPEQGRRDIPDTWPTRALGPPAPSRPQTLDVRCLQNRNRWWHGFQWGSQCCVLNCKMSPTPREKRILTVHSGTKLGWWNKHAFNKTIIPA